MKSLLMGLGVVYVAGFLVFGTYHLTSQSGWDIPRAIGYGLTWPLQIARAEAQPRSEVPRAIRDPNS